MESLIGNDSVNSDVSSSSKEVTQYEFKEIYSPADAQDASASNSLLEENLIKKLPDGTESIDSETDFFNEDLNINNVPNKKITEDVEDIVQDLENLLGESDEFAPKKGTSENIKILIETPVPHAELKSHKEINSANETTHIEIEQKEQLCGITLDKKIKSCSCEEVPSDPVCISEHAQFVNSSNDETNKNKHLTIEGGDTFGFHLNATKENNETEGKENTIKGKSKISFLEYASPNTEGKESESTKINKNLASIKDEGKQLSKIMKEVHFESKMEQVSEVVQRKNVNEVIGIATLNKEILSADNTNESAEVTWIDKKTGNTLDTISVVDVDETISTEEDQTLINLNESETQSASSKTNPTKSPENNYKNKITYNYNSDDDNNFDMSVKNLESEDRNVKESSVVTVTNQEREGSKIENLDRNVTTTAVYEGHVDEDVSSEAKSSIEIKETVESSFNENESGGNIIEVDETNLCKIEENNATNVINDSATSSTTDNINVIEVHNSLLKSTFHDVEHSDDHESDQNIQYNKSEKEIGEREIDAVIANKNLQNEIKSVCFDSIVQDTVIDSASNSYSHENFSCKVDSVSAATLEFRHENLQLQLPQTLVNDTSEMYNCVTTGENLNNENKNGSLDGTEVLSEQNESSEINKVTQLQEGSDSKLNSEEVVVLLQLTDKDNSRMCGKDDCSTINDNEGIQKIAESELNMKFHLTDKNEKDMLCQQHNTVDLTENTFISSDACTPENVDPVVQSPSHFFVETSNFPSIESSNRSNMPIHEECLDLKGEKLITIEQENIENNNPVGLEDISETKIQVEPFADHEGVNTASYVCNTYQPEFVSPKEDNSMVEVDSSDSVNQNNDGLVVSDNHCQNEPFLLIQSKRNESRLPEENDVDLDKTELNCSEFEKTNNDLFTENNIIIDLPPDETKITKSAVINEAQKSERKSISYSKEIKEIFESEDATQSAVASILSETVEISVGSEIETANDNSQLSSDVNKSHELTNSEVTIVERNETNIPENVLFSAFKTETSDETEIKKFQLQEIDSSSKILANSEQTKQVPYVESVKTLSQSDEVLKQPLQVDVIEHTSFSEKSDEQISTTTDGEFEAKNSLKITITKNKFDNMHSILKIFDPKDVHLAHEQNASEEITSKQSEHSRGESTVPKITIKPIPSTEGDFSPKYEITSKSDTDDSANKHFTVETVEGQSSPKLRIKSIYTDLTTSTTDVCKKNKGNEREIPIPRKITLKSKTEDTSSCSKVMKYSKTVEEVTSSHSPKITIKPIKLPEETREEPSRSQSPKIIFKSLSKLQEQSKTNETHGRQSPRITIKPVLKPDNQEPFKTCPKITIKPISKPESEICDELQNRKLYLKGSSEINRHDEQTCTPRITIKPIKSDKELDCHNIIDGPTHTPRITIKPIIKPDHTGKTFNKYPEDVAKEERRHSPRLVNKLLMKNDEEFKSDFSFSTEEIEMRKGPKLTIKPVIKHLTSLENVDRDDDSIPYSNKYIVESLQEFKERRNNSDGCNIPTVTIKPIIRPGIKETQYHSASSSNAIEESAIIPKITIKPVVKQECHSEEKNTPKIIIKPLIKPPKVLAGTSNLSSTAQSEIVSFVNKVNVDEVFPEVKRSKLEYQEAITSESSITPQPNSLKVTESKNCRKNVEEVELIDFEDQIKQERIVLKINKGTISSPSRSSTDKIEKLTRLKTKLAKESTKRGYSEHLNYETKKQKIEMGDVTISLIDSEDSHDSSDNVPKIGLKSNEMDRDYHDSVEIIPLDTLKKNVEREDDVVVVEDPLEDIPVFEITPETAAAMKQATNLLKPGISISNISSTAVTSSSPAPTQTPRKRGRPRKVPLEVREDFKDPPKEEIESVQIFEQNTSSRPKRSCRGQSVRSTLGMKPRKPRGGGNRGRGRGRRGGKQGIVMKMSIDALSFEEKEEEPLIYLQQKEDVEVSVDVNTNGNNETKISSECGVFSSTISTCSTNEISSIPETFPVSPIDSAQPPPPPVLEPPKSELYEEETRMSADSSRAHTPAKQTISTPLEVTIEESQSSIQSTTTTESEKNQKSRKIPKQEVHLEPEGEIISADKLAEYCWGGGGPFMLQEQVAQFLGIKSFKRKYPGIQRRPVDMQERDFIRESGLASEAMCDMGLTAVRSEDILDIMYADFQPKYEEYCKHQRDRHAKDISNKQKALNLAASQEKNKLDIVEQAIHSTSTWNANFNKSRREQRKGCMDLQTFTMHFPKGKLKEMNKPPVEHYPVALVPGQFCDFYRMYSPSELSNLPLNTCTYKISEDFLHETEDSQSDVSGSDSGSSSSDSESSDSSSGVEDCKMCRRTSSQKKILTQ